MPRSKATVLAFAALGAFAVLSCGYFGYALYRYYGKANAVEVSVVAPEPVSTKPEPPAFSPIFVPEPEPEPDVPPMAPLPANNTNVSGLSVPTAIKNLVLYLPFDTPGNIVDAVSGKTVGKKEKPGSITWIDGPRGKAVRLTATESRSTVPAFVLDLSDRLDAFATNPRLGFTVAFWTNPSDRGGLAFSLNSETITSAPRLSLLATKASFRMTYVQDVGKSTEQFSWGKTTSDEPQFRHFAMTRAVTGRVVLYLDGEEIAPPPGTKTAVNTSLAAKFKHVGLGRLSTSGYSVDIDEFCLFQRELTAKEIRTLAGK